MDWYPEDYALYPSESKQAKAVEHLSEVTEFLRSHGLPWEEDKHEAGHG